MSKYPVADGRDLDEHIDKYMRLHASMLTAMANRAQLDQVIVDLKAQLRDIFPSDDLVAANAVHMALLRTDQTALSPQFTGKPRQADHRHVGEVVQNWRRHEIPITPVEG